MEGRTSAAGAGPSRRRWRASSGTGEREQMTITRAETGEERHASWLELFFDLVAVAGIGALAHLLGEDSSTGGLAVYVIAFTAIWMIWACFTLYSNIAAGQTHVT